MASLTGFFTQQLVQFQDCFEKDTTAIVSISRTNSYVKHGAWIQSNVPTDHAVMVSAINVGILQPPGDLTNTLSFGCSSGHCNFSENSSPSFSTIAMRHRCQNLTSRIRVLNETRTNTDTPYNTKYL